MSCVFLFMLYYVSSFVWILVLICDSVFNISKINSCNLKCQVQFNSFLFTPKHTSESINLSFILQIKLPPSLDQVLGSKGMLFCFFIRFIDGWHRSQGALPAPTVLSWCLVPWGTAGLPDTQCLDSGFPMWALWCDSDRSCQSDLCRKLNSNGVLPLVQTDWRQTYSASSHHFLVPCCHCRSLLQTFLCDFVEYDCIYYKKLR